MKAKFALAMLAAFCFAAVPVFAQHDGGHEGGGHDGFGGHGDMHEMHGEMHESHSDHDASEDHHGGHHADHDGDADGDHDGDHDNDANEHSGKKAEDHDSGHGGIASKLSSNSQLASKLQALLPPGTDLQTAAQGFKNLGQFVAAVHVSKNLGIPFDQLKSKMTGSDAVSLGKAIHQLQPSANAKAATKQAEKQAHQDLESHDNS